MGNSKGSREAAGNDTDPAEVSGQIRRALDRCALYPDDSNVMAAISGNTVVLTGYVRTCAEHAAVVSAAWTACGIKAVIDELLVTA